MNFYLLKDTINIRGKKVTTKRGKSHIAEHEKIFSVDIYDKCFCCCLVTRSCLTLCHPMDCSLPDSSVHAISQVRILEWVAILSSRESSWPRIQTHISCINRKIVYHWATRETLYSSCIENFYRSMKRNSIFKRQKDLNWYFMKENIQIANKCFKRWASQVALVVKNPPANEGDIKMQVWS